MAARSPEEAARLILCDDHQVVRDGLCRVCERVYQVVGAASSGDELLVILKSHTADCLLLDLQMRSRSGLQLIGAIKRIRPAMKILMVTMHNDRMLAEASLSAGADGFIPKEATSDELLAAISEVLAGRRYLSSLVPKSSHGVGLGAKHLGLSRLTPRQQQIVLLLGEGKSGHEICQELKLSPSTITFHKHNIMRALGIDSAGAFLQYSVLVRAGTPADGTQSSNQGSSRGTA
jgi:DNA-binding NarL/FixJ family response regulator